MGWVGTLDWLQRHNLLYGTELADPEDLTWWRQQRANAPMDRVVDPWGCSKLKDHLNMMWYGNSTQELHEKMMKQAAEHNQQVQDMRGAHGQYQEACAGQVLPHEHYDRTSRRQWCLDPMTGQPVTMDCALGAQATALGESAVHTVNSGSHGRSLHGMPVDSFGTTEVLRSPPTTERSIGSRHMGVPGIKATSLSPRREVSSRARGLVAAGAPPPQAAGTHAYKSPLQTHRTARASGSSLAALLTTSISGLSSGSSAGGGPPVTSSVAAPVRPRSPMQGQTNHAAVPGRLSLPGVMQLRPSSSHGLAGAPSWR